MGLLWFVVWFYRDYHGILMGQYWEIDGLMVISGTFIETNGDSVEFQCYPPFAIENGSVEIVSVPITNGDFP